MIIFYFFFSNGKKKTKVVNKTTTRSVVNSPSSKTSYSNRLPSSDLTTKSNNVSSDLVDCKICGRHFDKERISKHEEVCLKSKRTKRKPFDALQQRVKGTEVEKYVNRKTKTVRNVPDVSRGHFI